MKLYIKQKAISWRDKFFVKHESGEDAYYAQGKFWSWRRKLHVWDMAGAEVAYIHRKMWTWRPRYYIEIGGVTYTLVKKIRFTRQELFIEGSSITMNGNFWAHEYTLHDGGRLMMSMSKHWFTWGDSYELDIADPQEALLCLGIALAVDCIMADASRQ